MLVGQEQVCKNPCLLLLSSNFCRFFFFGSYLVAGDRNLQCDEKVQRPKTYRKGTSRIGLLHDNAACVIL